MNNKDRVTADLSHHERLQKQTEARYALVKNEAVELALKDKDRGVFFLDYLYDQVSPEQAAELLDACLAKDYQEMGKIISETPGLAAAVERHMDDLVERYQEKLILFP
jgi:hypothetical protein